MRDPDLVLRAQRAASALERAWERWRVMHGFGADPLPPVSSYVGYSLEEPWGQPRVVFGIGADEAEKLAAILDGHDCVGPVHAEITGRPEWRQQAGQDWRQQSNGLDASPVATPGWPVPGTALHVPAQQPQPESERDGARLNGPARTGRRPADVVRFDEQDAPVPNGRPDGRAEQEPLAELPPFPDDESFGEDRAFADEPRFGDDRALGDRALAGTGLDNTGLDNTALDDVELNSQFAGEFVGAPVPADGESDSLTVAKPARGQSRTRQAAKSLGSSQRKAGQSDEASGAGQAKAPARRKPSLTSPLQMPKRVRPRRTAAAAEDEDEREAAIIADDDEATVSESERPEADAAVSDADD